MSARRQPSTTSLSRYARAHSPDFNNRTIDFCNAFWGLGDAGVDVLFARMRGAMRTTEELKNFWKERAMIEEQYAKRLASLAKFTLGRDEIGELRNSLDTLRLETDKQASFHLHIAQQMKADLEGQITVFASRQAHHKKTFQTAIEKEFKTKQTQEAHVNKAREKYEGDCVRINAYTAQSTLMQGKELEKTQLKLERAQQTVVANERDFASFSRALQDTVQKWELDWKAFCDSCQDLEEERIEFMKDNMWTYANAVSTVCVSDDESCERLRLALEQLEPERDMENFVRDYGTGNAIPDPPAFVNYANPNAIPASSQRPSTRPAQFQRASQRARQPMEQPPPPDDEPPVNTAGVGAGGGARRADSGGDAYVSRSRSQSRASVHRPQPQEYANGVMNKGAPQRGSGGPAGMRAPDPHGDLIDPTHKTMLKVGDHAYEVDITNDPQGRPGPSVNGHANGVVAPTRVGQDDDPLARQMAELRNGGSGSANGRKGQHQPQHSQSQNNSQAGSRRDSAAKLSPPPGSRGGGPPNRDYRHSAEIVVGSFPPSVPPSRPTSPNPPTASMVLPPNQGRGMDPVQNVVANYEQSFPGEHKNVSRPGSRAGSFTGGPSSHQQRPISGQGQAGQAGIGAQGRSPSPQPFMPPSRGTSPAVQQQQQNDRRNSYRGPPPNVHQGPGPNGIRQASPARGNSISVPQAPMHQQRPTSPNSVGIALGHDGRVAMDVMADAYNNAQSQPPQPQPPNHSQVYRPPQAPPPQHAPPQPTQRVPGYMPPQSQPPYGAPPPAPGYTSGYAQPPLPPVQQPIPQGQPMYGGPPQAHYAQPPPTQGYAQPPPQPMVHRAPSMNAGAYYGGDPRVGMGQQPMGGGVYGREPNDMRAASPQPPRQQMQPPPPVQAQPPTGNYTEDGRGILFYVKALYDYQAVIEEEFDFQAGDIIAVTDTPEDGWWSGELLDEARRKPGQHVFPSNFVCLF